VSRPGIGLLALLAFGCASVAPELQGSLVLRGQPFSVVFATALDALAELGARPVTVRPREGGGVLTARVRTAASRSGCGCPVQQPLESDTRSRDNLGTLLHSRRLVRAYPGILDSRLR
jgi:hypothetical protein